MEIYDPFTLKKIILPYRVNFICLSDSGEGFDVKVAPEGDRYQTIDIQFETVLAYKCLDEGDRLKLWENFLFSQQTFIYNVLNSDFMRDFHEQSYNIHFEESLRHFFIVTTDSCLDVISESDPTIILSG